MAVTELVTRGEAVLRDGLQDSHGQFQGLQESR